MIVATVATRGLAGAGRHPDRRVDPDRGSRRHAVDAGSASENRATTQKPDSGHDLRGDAVRVPAPYPN
jgi:hypothetical protein